MMKRVLGLLTFRVYERKSELPKHLLMRIIQLDPSLTTTDTEDASKNRVLTFFSTNIPWKRCGWSKPFCLPEGCSVVVFI